MHEPLADGKALRNPKRADRIGSECGASVTPALINAFAAIFPAPD